MTATPRPRRTGARETPPDAGVRLRIVVTDPVPGVAYRVQVGRDGLHPPAQEGARAVTFEFALRVGNARDGAPNFLPPFAQGPGHLGDGRDCAGGVGCRHPEQGYEEKAADDYATDANHDSLSRPRRR